MRLQEFDPKVRRQLAKIHIVGLLAALAFFAGLGGLYLWRLHHFPRAIATIDALEDKTVNRRGPVVVTVALLSFTRVSSTGTTEKCQHAFEIGRPSDGFKLGDRLEIVPDSGGCSRIDIVGRAKPTPSPQS